MIHTDDQLLLVHLMALTVHTECHLHLAALIITTVRHLRRGAIRSQLPTHQWAVLGERPQTPAASHLLAGTSQHPRQSEMELHQLAIPPPRLCRWHRLM